MIINVYMDAYIPLQFKAVGGPFQLMVWSNLIFLQNILAKDF